ncbi:MAG: asparagine synthase (glutamine-hydrolyzing) [Pseudomonadota bacterium]
MCGLAGIFNLDGRPVDRRVLEAMSRTLAHRGPDDQGLAIFDLDRGGEAEKGALGLASRRLAIIDLSPAGRMPLADRDRSVFVVFNGEIYNYRELRAELEKLGRAFITGADTEVIAAAYKEWGQDCQRRFNGMWALALFDAGKKTVFCSRDRMGVKPFYYFLNNRTFVFASEIKALLAHPDLSTGPAPAAMFNYLARSYRFVDGRPTTFFNNVFQLEPGTGLLVGTDSWIEKKYWSLSLQAPFTGSEEEASARFLEILTDAVRLRLRSDVRVAAQLSGGLDSSAVAALAARELGPGLPVFSACFDEKPFDEREFIEPTAAALKAEPHFVFPGPDGLRDELPRMIRAFDEPVCTVTFFAHWRVLAEVKRLGFKVLLNGHGADELAAGYYDHYLHNLADLRAEGALTELAAEKEAWLRLHGREREKQQRDYFALLDRGGEYMADCLKNFAPHEAALGPALKYETGGPDRPVGPFPSLLANRLYRELLFETVPAVLKAEDRTTMAHSVESRLPFLDYRLVEFMFSLPGRLKIKNGLGKHIQRKALRGIIPEPVRTRTEKVGFNAPSEKWFREGLQDWVEETARSPRLFNQGILDRPGFDRLWGEHRSGRANHYQFLWQVLNLDLWLAEYF